MISGVVCHQKLPLTVSVKREFLILNLCGWLPNSKSLEFDLWPFKYEQRGQKGQVDQNANEALIVERLHSAIP